MRTPVLTAVAIAIAACGSTPKPTPRPVVAAEADPAFPGPSVPAPVVTLIDAGAEPRRELRYEPVRDARGQIDMRLGMRIGMTMNGRAQTIPVPVMLMRMETVVTRVSATSFDMAAKVIATDVEPGTQDPTMVAAVRTAIGKMVGMSVTVRMDRRGRVLAGDASVPPGLDESAAQLVDSVKQSMSQAAAPFPDEPVGPGARWSVATSVETSKLTLNQTAVFELSAQHDKRGEVTVAIEQTAPKQVVRTPGESSQMTTTLDSLASHGKGTMTYDLVTVMPAAVDLSMETAIAMSMAPAGATADNAMKMGMEMGIDMTMRPTPAGN